jgi:hypothetical protein
MKRIHLLTGVILIGLSSPIVAKAQPSSGQNQSCLERISPFTGGYKAGKTTANALIVGYEKASINEKKSWKKTLLTSQNAMTQAGVAIMMEMEPKLSNYVSCYISAYEKLNPGFIAGFRDALTPELKKLYTSLPMY